MSFRPHEVCTLSLESRFTQAYYSAIVLLFLPLWLKLHDCYHRPWNQSLQSITVPLCHHILPHPIDFPEHSHHRSSYFLLILGHWQVNSVDYQCDEDIRGLKWEARKRHTEAVCDDLHAACGRAAVCRQRAIGAFHLCQPEGTTKKTQNKKLIIYQTFSFWSIFNIHHVNKMNQCNKQGPSYHLILLNERQDFNVVPHNQRSTMLISLNL